MTWTVWPGVSTAAAAWPMFPVSGSCARTMTLPMGTLPIVNRPAASAVARLEPATTVAAGTGAPLAFSTWPPMLPRPLKTMATVRLSPGASVSVARPLSPVAGS